MQALLSSTAKCPVFSYYVLLFCILGSFKYSLGISEAVRATRETTGNRGHGFQGKRQSSNSKQDHSSLNREDDCMGDRLFDRGARKHFFGEVMPGKEKSTTGGSVRKKQASCEMTGATRKTLEQDRHKQDGRCQVM